MIRGPSDTEPVAPPSPLRLLLALATLVTIGLPRLIHIFSQDGTLPSTGPLVDYLTILYPADLLLGALAVVSLVELGRRLRSRQLGLGATGWLVVSVLLTLSWLAHPSPRGVMTLVEQYGAVALAATLAECWHSGLRDAVLATAAAIAATESVWILAQRIHGGAIGLHVLGEQTHPFYAVGGSTAPDGSLRHGLILTGLSLIVGALLATEIGHGRRPRLWTPVATLVAVPIGLEYSRTALLGLALLVGVLAVAAFRERSGGQRRLYLVACGALLVGTLVPAAIWSAGWRGRAAAVTSAASGSGADRVDSLSTGRKVLISEAVRTIEAHPLAGVGPGRYTIALRDHYHGVFPSNAADFRAVHNVPLLVAAEGGVLAGLAVVALLIALGWRALRGGPAPLGVFVAFLPVLLLDKYPYSLFEGAVLTGLWLAALDATTSPTLEPDEVAGLVRAA